MVIIEEKPGYPGDFGKAFDSEECLKIARDLCEKGKLIKSSDGSVHGTPPGMVSIVDLSHEMHRDHGRLAKVLEDAGWFETIELGGYYFPPELKRGLE